MEIINLDMTPSTVAPNAHAGQYDSARTVRFMLKNGGMPFTLAGTETITAEITRSDNTEVTVNVENTSSSYVDVVFDDTVCTVKGLYACELRLKDSDGFDIGSKNFALLVQRDPYDGTGVHIETVGPADICTFETTLAEPLQSVIVDIEATGGNGTPDNPNPINGYTEANITRCGVNLWGHADVTIDRATYVVNNEDIFLPAGTYTFQFKFSGTVNNKSCRIDDADGNQIATFGGAVSSGLNSDTFTIPSGKVGVKFKFYAAAIGTFSDMMFAIGSTTPEFTPYNGTPYTIAFGQKVYGGVLDVTRGKLHVTHYGVEYDGTEDGWSWYGDYQQASIALPYPAKYDATEVSYKCNRLTPVANQSRPANIGNYSSLVSSGANGAFSTPETSLANFKTWLGSNHVQFVYELATPFDIDLTPEVISAIVGTNNVFADCGETTVKYLKAGA